jgi:hypothetical protein
MALASHFQDVVKSESLLFPERNILCGKIKKDTVVNMPPVYRG